MKKLLNKYSHILGIAPSSRGFGFGLMEGTNVLIDWGVKTVAGEKNNNAVTKLRKMLDHYEPDLLALEDCFRKPFTRAARIRALTKRFVGLATTRGIRVQLLVRRDVFKVLLGDARGTKQALTEVVAKQFPMELGFRAPPKRQPWMSANYRIDIFSAVALALAACRRRSN